MKRWNEEYQVYVTDDGKVFNKKMEEYKLKCTSNGYIEFNTRRNYNIVYCLVHRLVYETFVGKIPEGLQIDHINNVRTDNRLENLQLLSRLENVRKAKLNKPTSEFGLKYFEHFGYSKAENPNQYSCEHKWFLRHGYCRWESHP